MVTCVNQGRVEMQDYECKLCGQRFRAMYKRENCPECERQTEEIE